MVIDLVRTFGPFNMCFRSDEWTFILPSVIKSQLFTSKRSEGKTDAKKPSCNIFIFSIQKHWSKKVQMKVLCFPLSVGIVAILLFMRLWF